MRKFLKEIQNWLLKHYDGVCAEDPEWIIAKCGILSDQRLESLWLGETFFLQQQSVLKRNKDNKAEQIMNRKIVINTPKPKRRGGRGGKKGPKATRKTTVVVQQQSRPRRRNNRSRGGGARRPRQRGGRNGGRMLTMKGSNTQSWGSNKIVTPFERDEFIANVAGSVNFANTSYSVNPGNSTTFPWLGGMISGRYEKYMFAYCEFYFKRMVSEFATNGTTGKVMFMFDSDAGDAPPTTKQQMEDTEPHSDCMPCENMFFRIPESILNKFTDGFYVRGNTLPGGADIKTFDVGNLHVATQDCANTNTIGELRVRYKVFMMVPVLDSTTSAPTNLRASWFQTTTTQTLTTSVQATLALPTATTNGLSIVNTAGSMVPPTGNYLVDFAATLNDSSNEVGSLELDFIKNAATVYQGTLKPYNTYATGTGNRTSCSGSVYVSANGTDAFLLKGTAVGAAGTLTVTATCRWLAI